MRKQMWLGGSALVAAAGFGLAVAQTPQPATPAPGQVAPVVGTQPGALAAAGQAYRAKQLLGSRISLQGNAAAGTVDDIVFSHEGVIDYLIVTTSGGSMVTVPWDAAKFDFAGRTATINLTPEQFRAIPTYTVQTYPNFYTPAYRTETYRFYNLTPGQERRLERRLERRP